MLTHLLLIQPYEVGIIIKPVLKMKKHAQKSDYFSFLKYYKIRIKHVHTLLASNLDQETFWSSILTYWNVTLPHKVN